MLVITRYKKQHVIGGAGIFDTISNFVKKLVTSNAAKQIASTISSAAKTDLGKTAIDAGKSVAMAAIDVGKSAVIKKLTQKSRETLAKLTDEPNTNINNITMGQGIAIQELVKRLNGSGMKVI